MRKALCEAVGEEDLRQIAEALKRKAKEGDVAAARLVLSYVVGRPEATVNPDTLDEQEMRQYLREPELATRMPEVLQTIDVETCCDVVRVARPGMVEAMREQMAEAMITGRVPGTGEQVAPPLDPAEWMRQDVTEEESAPSPNRDNGKGRKDRTGCVSAARKRARYQQAVNGHQGNPTGARRGPGTARTATPANGRRGLKSSKTPVQPRSDADGSNGPLRGKKSGPEKQSSAAGHRQRTAKTEVPGNGVTRSGVRGC
jgi:hypothetical protein